MHTLTGTNCYLIGTGSKRILVDTGEGIEGFVDLLREVMHAVGCDDLESIVLTHWHADHVGGVNDICRSLGKAVPVFKRRGPRKESFSYCNIEDGQVFTTQGGTIEAVYTPGHTEDHVAFILREERALLCGDMILGCGTAVFDDFTSYMSSLDRVLRLCGNTTAIGQGLTRIYPGHGPVVEDAEEKIKYYITHRRERENQILETLMSANGSAVSTFQITSVVYGDLPLPVMVSAHYNVMHHMSKLLSEGKVKRTFLPMSFVDARGATKQQ
ncbi:unnamed protein product [Choristocarpus tenellus]